MDDSNNSSYDYHQMGRRGHQKNYCWPGTYHITISVKDRRQQPMGRIVGDTNKPDGDPQAPHVVLSAVGKMVEQELTNSISKHYSMIEVQDYVIMPDHLHCIIVVHSTIISKNGRVTHLGQVIAGFKKGCNRRYWELTGQADGQKYEGGKPANASNTAQQGTAQQGTAQQGTAQQGTAHDSRFAVSPQGNKVPSHSSSGRPPFFASGYVDVMPLEEGQLERQRQYIRNNPRYRLLRMSDHNRLQAHRGSINTAVTLPALKKYLQQERGPKLFTAETWEHLQQHLLTQNGIIMCDSYGDLQLLQERLLPVVCHRKDAQLFSTQKGRCLTAANEGAVLVSARIAKGEQDIINTATDKGHPVVLVEDNGLSEHYHPSEERTNRCATGKLLMVTPWKYVYRHKDEQISYAECKTMNCIAQALCRMKDSWWKER